MSEIKKVAVIGAGLMGSGIAAQIANAGIPVVLLDIVPPKLEDFGGDRSAFSKGAIKKMLKSDPAPFMHPSNAKLIAPGNLEDDIELIKDCDWICEVVLEDVQVKHQTYELLNKHRKKGSIISSNTSTIPLAELTDGFDTVFKSDFLITHFFNPPRYLRLLEIVRGPETRDEAVKVISDFCDVALGKGVVMCNDTPGFIANRLLVYCLTNAINIALEENVPIEVADAVMKKPVGFPNTAVFGLLDLIGIDLMPYLSKSLLARLPKSDPYHEVFVDHPFIHQMIEQGYTGRKGKGGFTRLDPEAKAKGKKVKQVLKLDAEKFDESSYYVADKPQLESVKAGKQGLKAVVTTEDQGGAYAWKVLSRTLHYAASLVPEITDTVFSADEAMKLGCNWKMGPFEMIDALGPAWLAEQFEKEGMGVPELLKKVGEGTFYQVEDGALHYFGTDGKYHQVVRPEGVLLLRDIKLSSEPVMKNGSASVWDIGDGVLCFEKHSKMNTFDEQIFDLLDQATRTIEKSDTYRAMVIYNEASHFSAGANLGLALFAVNIAMWSQVQGFVDRGQEVFTKLKFAGFPVVSAPSGMALGGGCEILLNADAVQAHAETYCGLVEVGVGVIPGWGGCKEMILRFQEREAANHNDIWFSPKTTPMGAVRKAFETIGLASVAKSAQEARSIGYFRETDGITMNRDRLLYDAKQKALSLVDGYEAPEKREDIRLPGPSGKMALNLAVADFEKNGKATPYDVVVSDHLAEVLSGGAGADWTRPVTEDQLLRLERDQFMSLLHNQGTLERIEHMLDTGKPLRN